MKCNGKPPSSLNTQSSVPFTVRFAAPKEAPVSASADGPLWTPATESGDADNSIQQIRSHSMSDNNAERPSIQNFQNGEVMNGNEWPQPVEAQYPGSNLKRWGSHSSSIIGTGATIQAPPGLPNQQIPAAMMGQPEPQVFSPSAQTYSDAFSAADAHAAGLPPGTITSASEQKALSMRWWHAAFSLARELRLNQEKKPNSDNVQSPTAMKHAVPDFDADPFFGLGNFDFDQGLMEFMETRSEQSDNVRSPVQQGVTDLEHNEERRRTWWLCYIQDRHLALCYNRAVALLDAECEDLLLPMDEAAWQSGSFLVDPSNVQRPSFPSFQCTGHSFFDFFLPLMTIAGEILNLNHLKNDPLLGKFFHESMQTRKIEAEITGRLHEYETSLKFFEPANTQGYAIEQDADQAALHTKTVVAYATHVAQVLHILLVGKWDPSTLFDDADYVLSSPAYSSTMAHALSAASAVEQILDLDPDLSFMPYFLGIQLLQGSFPLLLILDRLSTKADRKIIDACEIIVRATEACVSTLDTEYQRNYRQILRSAITQARGRYVPQKESTFRRKAVLALYRWTRSGTGLAL
ncbi:putative c6 transcription factor [Phaeomoniella chlamydospora]|uniref:Putative c6 transcription factor n=1 Tax=Phaeomoniella chlamydospora TaxID=158046 RepID=A0A0G2GYG5_PHACM|nr:putative c6 transcription factor [Phaeomoniella chlamydospora]